jgi:hypothetical protein
MPLNSIYIRDIVRSAKNEDPDDIARCFTLLIHPFQDDKHNEWRPITVTSHSAESRDTILFSRY